MNYGILMACYLAINGQYVWVEGREVQEVMPRNHAEQSLFAPSNGAQAIVVETNNCKYLEDPVAAYSRMLESRKVGKSKVGSWAWCLVNEWGEQQCTFDTMEQCMKRATRLDYCEPNEDYKTKRENENEAK